MGFFDNTTPTGGLQPINRERIKQALDTIGWNYQVDDDGDIMGGWEHGYFLFGITGNNAEVLIVRGTWYGTLPGEKLADVNQLIMDWNRETIWPKTYSVYNEEEDVVRVNCEHSMDYEFGLTNDQLRQHLLCSVTTGASFFEKLTEVFPEGMPAE
ncbi:hypothetical protein JOD55_000569 [Arcanobacterium pluranimalium]|uniref:YbjN domain-containing protein n=1 Tax=Arcanobacterium pluranimalium TaxID=108028 RepID=UPI001958604C|nr:YbjN domain-containing protein [Arcanobacterium pluranimalium]MBM7824742.1 hypothetical protein [Arcanobacterium pluranimalium]